MWDDSSGREVHVCTHGGALAASVRQLELSLVGVWDEQYAGYVGWWQQWRSDGADTPLAFPISHPDGREPRHSSGFFRWAADREAIAEEVDLVHAAAAAAIAAAAEAAALGRNASDGSGSEGAGSSDESGANAHSNVSSQVLSLKLFPRRVVGGWSQGAAGRHFGAAAAVGGHAHGTWNASFREALSADAVECSWLNRRDGGASSAAEGSAAKSLIEPTGPDGPLHSAPSPTAVTAVPSPLHLIAAAIGTHLPFELLGAARLTHGVLPVASATSQAAATATADVSRSHPRQYIELTSSTRAQAGAVLFTPAPALASYGGCRGRLSIHASVFAGQGSDPGGDGINLVLGAFRAAELLHTLFSANASFGGRELLVLRVRRPSLSLGSIELSLRDETLWRMEEPMLMGRWLELHLMLAGAPALHLAVMSTYTRMHAYALTGASVLSLTVNGVPVALGLLLPNGGWLPEEGWRMGITASTHAFTDLHAVADARGSCGDGPVVDVPFTVAADVWPAAQPSLWPDEQQPLFRYHAEPKLKETIPALGHLTGGSLVQIGGSGLQRGVDYECAFGNATWTAASWREESGHLVCLSPAVSHPHTAMLRVALNGQQLSIAWLNYTFCAPRITAIEPASGSSVGGTIVTVSGTSLQLDDDAPLARCVFDSAQQTNATWSAELSALVCRAPMLHQATTSRVVPFSISLNGQEQTSNDPPLSFFYFHVGAVRDFDRPPALGLM